MRADLSREQQTKLRRRNRDPYQGVPAAGALGPKVVVWTVNEVNEILALARLGVDGIITRLPESCDQGGGTFPFAQVMWANPRGPLGMR